MPIYLKQSTASQEVALGFFVDATDGDTAETGLTIANTDIKLHKAGATTLANKNSGGATHISGGVYYCVLDATDTDTLGSLVLFVHVSGALAVRVECVVLAANIYDSLIGGGDLLDVNTSQFGNTNGTFSSGRPEVNTTHIAGSAISTSSAQIGVNVVNAGGTAWGSGAITAASIASDAITAAKIATDAIDADALADNAITAATFAAGAITAAVIATDAIDADAIADNAINAGALAADCITAAKIADGAIDANTFASAAITATAIASDAITAAKIASDAITTAKIADGTITAAKLASDCITDAKVASDVTIASVTGSVGSVSGAVGSVTGNVGGNVTGSIGSLATQAKADVNAEVLDVLNVDTFAEPGQETPPATQTIRKMLHYLYKAWRNRKTNDGTTIKLYADDATTVDQKQTVSESSGTISKAEWTGGP